MRKASFDYCLYAPGIRIVVRRAHPVRGESHIQRNATGEVATPHRSGIPKLCLSMYPSAVR